MVDSLDIERTSQLDALWLDPLPETRQRSLRLRFGSQDSAVVPLEQISEILRVEVAEILPIPAMPSCVLGVCNWRGEMLWLIDLCDFIDYPSPFQLEHPPTSLMAIVVQVNNQAIGVGVQQVNDIELHDFRSLQPVVPGLFAPGLLPLIAGLLPESNDAVLKPQSPD